MYQTNADYRQSIRDFCKMNYQDPNKDLDIDDETRDEQLFDFLASKNTMDFIFEKTKDHPLWQDLYEKSAAKFISSDLEIGLSILFCYDYFWHFKICWYSFIENPVEFDKNNEFYKSLLSLLD